MAEWQLGECRRIRRIGVNKENLFSHFFFFILFDIQIAGREKQE